MDHVADSMIATLRRYAPAKVRVYDAQDNAREVAVPSKRKRWAQVATTIDARPWVRCVLLDKQGLELGYIENDGAAEELEDIGGGGAQTASHRWFLEMMIKAQTTALGFRDKEHTTLLASMRDILEVQTQATREMITIMRMQRDEAMELAQIRAAAEQGSDVDQILKLIEASPKLLGTLGPILAALMGGKRKIAAAGAAPSNGAKSHP